MIEALVYAFASYSMLGANAGGAHGSVSSSGVRPTIGYETSGRIVDTGAHGLNVGPSRLPGVHKGTSKDSVDFVGVSGGCGTAFWPN